jgi:hypothetical protein
MCQILHFLAFIFNTIEDEQILNTWVETYARDPRDTSKLEFFIRWWWCWSQSKREIFDGFGLKYGLSVGILVTQRLSDRTRSTYLIRGANIPFGHFSTQE